MASFAVALKYVLENEGGWTIDDGGWTNYGLVVSDVAKYRNVLTSQITEQDMRNLEMPEVTAIYQQQYWYPVNGDLLLDTGVATCILDTAVNRGISVGAKYAQRVCNISGLGLTVDGKIGPKSVAAINQMNRHIFIASYEAMELAGYEAIIAQDPGKYARYRAGWESRAKRLLTLI